MDSKPISGADRDRLRDITLKQEQLVRQLIALRAEEDKLLGRAPWQYDGKPDRKTGPRKPKEAVLEGRASYFRTGFR